jgi:hypothetical protein
MSDNQGCSYRPESNIFHFASSVLDRPDRPVLRNKANLHGDDVAKEFCRHTAFIMDVYRQLLKILHTLTHFKLERCAKCIKYFGVHLRL